MNDTLKAAGRIGAELGAAKAEVERLSHKLERARDHLTHARHDVEIRANAGNDAARLVLKGIDQWLSDYDQSPDDTYTAVDMATAAAQGFRDGQAAVEQAAAQDERKTFEVEIPDISAIYDGRSFIPYRSLEAGERLMTVAQHLRIEKQLRAALTRPAQTEQQPVAINPDPPELMIRWHESPESVHRAMWESVAIREGMTYDELLAEGVTCGFDESGNEVEMEAGADIEGMRMQGCWAFVDTLNSCIHAWAAPDTDRGLVLHMLAHEIGHATGTPHPDGFQEEMRAEQFGRVAAAAYRMLLDKDRPQCTAPACGCADAYCMAWPDEAAPIAQTAPQGKFRMGDLVKKSTGSEWEGHICGTYSTELTPEGYAVESAAHRGSVQIYPAKALEAVE